MRPQPLPQPLSQPSEPLRLNLPAFADSGKPVAGQKALLAFPRLVAETGEAGAERMLAWHARAESRLDPAGVNQIWLHLKVNVTLPLQCQRCLDAMDVPLNLARWFRFVESEALAWAHDETAQEEDVLVWSRELDLLALIEDEVLMALPLVVRHEVCPNPVLEVGAAQAHHPFAALGKLRDPAK